MSINVNITNFYRASSEAMKKLFVCIEEGCWSCQETSNIVADIALQFPDLEIELLDLRYNYKPDFVFATPTYVLDDRIIFLGNPTSEELKRKLTDFAEAGDDMSVSSTP
jgi:hypothetical protein